MTDKEPKKKLKYITIIWEELPENVSYFVVPRSEITKEDLRMLKACHNNWLNATAVDTARADKKTIDRSLVRLNSILVNPELDWLSNKYRDEQAENCGLPREEFDELLGKWYSYRLNTDSPRTLPRSKLYRTGFLM